MNYIAELVMLSAHGRHNDCESFLLLLFTSRSPARLAEARECGAALAISEWTRRRECGAALAISEWTRRLIAMLTIARRKCCFENVELREL